MMRKISAAVAAMVLALSYLAVAMPAAYAQGTLLATPGVGPNSGSGIGELGISDASIADNTSSGRLWMSYSAVAPTARSSVKTHWLVSLRLAHSDNGGASWQDAGFPVEGVPEFGNGSSASAWNSEVSSLVHDPWGPPAEQWKLFWHRYLMINGAAQFAPDGWIAYKAAATPEGLQSAQELKLFSGKGYSPVNNSPSGATQSPIAGAPLIPIWQRSSDLGCIAITEPGAMATSAGIYLAASCIEFSLANLGPTAKIVLLKCAAPCSVASPTAWQYVATLLTEGDAGKFGFDKFSGADLFMEQGRAFLIVSPVSNHPVKNAYNGCYVFRFADLNKGTLETQNGLPSVLAKIEGAPNSFNGACTYQPTEANGGVILNQVLFKDRPIFELLDSHQHI